MTITEKVAYLKGLADGLDLKKKSAEGSKLLNVIIDVLEDISYAIEDLEEADEMLSEGLDAVSEDLEDVEDLLFEDEDEDECGCGCGCGHDQFFEMECPGCDEALVIDESVLEAGQITCPNCGHVFVLGQADDESEDEDENEDEDED